MALGCATFSGLTPRVLWWNPNFWFFTIFGGEVPLIHHAWYVTHHCSQHVRDICQIYPHVFSEWSLDAQYGHLWTPFGLPHLRAKVDHQNSFLAAGPDWGSVHNKNKDEQTNKMNMNMLVLLCCVYIYITSKFIIIACATWCKCCHHTSYIHISFIITYQIHISYIRFIYIYVHIYIINIYIYIPRASKTQTIVGPVKKIVKPCFFLKKKKVCWICTILSKSGGHVSNFCLPHVATSYWQVPKSVKRNTPSKPKQTTHDVRILHRLQLPPMLRTLPSAGLEVVKKSLWICMAFQKSAFQMWTQQNDDSSDNLRCFLFAWIGQLPAPICKTTSGASKLDVAAVHSQRQKNYILSTG